MHHRAGSMENDYPVTPKSVWYRETVPVNENTSGILYPWYEAGINLFLSYSDISGRNPLSRAVSCDIARHSVYTGTGSFESKV